MVAAIFTLHLSNTTSYMPLVRRRIKVKRYYRRGGFQNKLKTYTGKVIRVANKMKSGDKSINTRTFRLWAEADFNFEGGVLFAMNFNQ